jgi:hypothetical protein
VSIAATPKAAAAACLTAKAVPQHHLMDGLTRRHAGNVDLVSLLDAFLACSHCSH